MTRRTKRFTAALLVAAVLCASAVALFHIHLTGGFRPDCPACQQERTLGSSSGALTLSIAPAPLVVIGVVPDPGALPDRLDVTVHRSSPRSPPFSL